MNQTPTIAIISDSVCGSYLCSLLEQKKINCILVHTNPSGVVATENGTDYWQSQIPFFAKSQDLDSAIDFLQPFYAEPIIHQEFALEPITFSANESRPFVGFGESKANAIPALSQYHTSHAYQMSNYFLRHFSESALNLKAQQHHLAEITSFDFRDSRLESISLNGQQKIYADAFVVLTSPKDYLHLLPAELVSTKLRSRTAKSHMYSRVTVRFDLSDELTSNQNLIFMMSDSTEIEPCVGYFGRKVSVDGSAENFSLWQTFVEQFQVEDPDFLMTTIRNLRRHSKRAFPALENKLKESIFVETSAFGDWSWVLESKEFQSMGDNLLISPSLSFSGIGASQIIVAASRMAQTLLDRWAMISTSPTESPADSPSMLSHQISATAHTDIAPDNASC